MDFDRNDKLKYSWQRGIPSGDSLRDERITVTYDKPGIYKPSVTVTDKEGKTATAQVEIRAGNEPPSVSIALMGANKTFYSNNAKIDYSVPVTDNEDGTLEKGIDPRQECFYHLTI